MNKLLTVVFSASCLLLAGTAFADDSATTSSKKCTKMVTKHGKTCKQHSKKKCHCADADADAGAGADADAKSVTTN